MICPECGSEYREGYLRCGSCEVALIAPPPAYEPVPRDVALVKVYETGDPVVSPLFESLLEEAGIEFMVRRDTVRDYFGWGFGTNPNRPVAPVEYWVREENADEARAIAATLDSTPEVPPE